MAGERDGGVASGSQADHPARLRWAVNTERWNPEGDHEGAEFTFLLSLLPQHEREDCLRFVHMPDKKRALVSRLLQRAACARVTSAHVQSAATSVLPYRLSSSGDEGDVEEEEEEPTES